MNHTTNPTAVIYAALEGLQGTTHHLPPGTRQAVAEHLARVLPAAPPSAVVSADRATLLREVAEEVASHPGPIPYRPQLDEDGGFWWDTRDRDAVVALLRRKANEAEFAATPCSPVVQCEDGGEPCDVHERLLGHYDDSHELCPPDCGAADGPRRVAAEEQPAETQDGFELRGTAEIRAAALEEAALIAVAENNTCPAVYQCQPCLTRERVAADLLRAAAKERPAVGEQPDTQTREADDPTQCSGDEGFCPEHGFHRHSLKQPGTP